MKKENFICPCCGLPNHLEFESIADYNEIRNLSEAAQDSFVSDEKGNIFKNYIIDEDNKEEIGEELTKKFKKIKSISNRYTEDSFKNWFDKNVVCFVVNENDNYVWLGSLLFIQNIDDLVKTQENLTGIENYIITQNRLTGIELNKQYDVVNYNDYELHTTYQYNIKQTEHITEIGTEQQPLQQKEYTVEIELVN